MVDRLRGEYRFATVLMRAVVQRRVASGAGGGVHGLLDDVAVEQVNGAVGDDGVARVLHKTGGHIGIFLLSER